MKRPQGSNVLSLVETNPIKGCSSPANFIYCFISDILRGLRFPLGLKGFNGGDIISD